MGSKKRKQKEPIRLDKLFIEFFSEELLNEISRLDEAKPWLFVTPQFTYLKIPTKKALKLLSWIVSLGWALVGLYNLLTSISEHLVRASP